VSSVHVNFEIHDRRSHFGRFHALDNIMKPRSGQQEHTRRNKAIIGDYNITNKVGPAWYQYTTDYALQSSIYPFNKERTTYRDMVYKSMLKTPSTIM
jgi:hypothetical protein